MHHLLSCHAADRIWIERSSKSFSQCLSRFLKRMSCDLCTHVAARFGSQMTPFIYTRHLIVRIGKVCGVSCDCLYGRLEPNRGFRRRISLEQSITTLCSTAECCTREGLFVELVEDLARERASIPRQHYDILALIVYSSLSVRWCVNMYDVVAIVTQIERTL